MFPVLSTDREEIAQATRSYLNPNGERVAKLVAEADDETISHIARKAGDFLIEGGSYYEALAYAAELVLEVPSLEQSG